MNQLAQAPLILSEAVGGIEPAQAGAAQRAAAMPVEWKLVQKGRAATRAEEIRRQRFRRAQTGCADGNTRNFSKGSAADAAIVGKEKRKKAARDLSGKTVKQGQPD